jgi:hypothetical protein
MNEAGFVGYMENGRKSPNTIKSYVNSVKIYEDYFKTRRGKIDADNASPVDLKDFVRWEMGEDVNVYRHLWGIRMYYEYLGLDEMEKTAREWMEYVQNETRKLGEFPKVDRDSVKALSGIGIRTVNQLLMACSTSEKREQLAIESGVLQEALLELVKLSNLSRLPGLKKVRGRLFYDAGLDTLPKIATLEPEEVQNTLSEFIWNTGFEGSAPTYSEANVAVTMARFLPETIDDNVS